MSVIHKTWWLRQFSTQCQIVKGRSDCKISINAPHSWATTWSATTVKSQILNIRRQTGARALTLTHALRKVPTVEWRGKKEEADGKRLRKYLDCKWRMATECKTECHRRWVNVVCRTFQIEVRTSQERSQCVTSSNFLAYIYVWYMGDSPVSLSLARRLPKTIKPIDGWN